MDEYKSIKLQTSSITFAQNTEGVKIMRIKKQAVIANGVQRNEAICLVLAGFLLKTGQIASSCLLLMNTLILARF